MQQMQKKKFFETVDLLKDPIDVTPQAVATKVKFPCTGFCFFAAQHVPLLVQLYNKKNKLVYNALIVTLIQKAGERKKNNKSIHQEGENPDDETIKKDFKMAKKMKFHDLNTVDEQGKEYAINTIGMSLMNLKSNEFVIITRSQETFMIVKLTDKLDDDKYLVIDSHKTKHGTVNLMDALLYIIKNNKYIGLIKMATY